MISVQCRHLTLSEIADLHAIDEYNMMVRPLSYEFDLERDAAYAVIGLRMRRGTPCLYLTAVSGEREVQIVPAVLFGFDWQEIPSDWQVRITPEGDIDLLPSRLAAIEGWFERYVGVDSRVVEIVNREVDRAR